MQEDRGKMRRRGLGGGVECLQGGEREFDGGGGREGGDVVVVVVVEGEGWVFTTI